MCSKRCANPVRPGSSLAGPTWYQRLTATMGTRASRLRITSRPFGSVYFSNAMRGMSFADERLRCSLFCADTAGQPSHRGNEDNEKAQIRFVQHDVCIRQPFQPRPFLLVLIGGVCETRPQVPTGHGSIRPPRLPDFRQPLGRRQRAKPIRSLDGLDDAEVPDGQHIGPMQAEHQEHLSRPAPDALDARQRRNHLIVGQRRRVSRDPANRPGFVRTDRARTSASGG